MATKHEILEDKTVKELRQMARDKDLSGYSNLRKDELIEMIDKNYSKSEAKAWPDLEEVEEEKEETEEENKKIEEIEPEELEAEIKKASKETKEKPLEMSEEMMMGIAVVIVIVIILIAVILI